MSGVQSGLEQGRAVEDCGQVLEGEMEGVNGLWEAGGDDLSSHTATHCNTRDDASSHTATHCNTLQHTATHCNTRDDVWSKDSEGVETAGL